MVAQRYHQSFKVSMPFSFASDYSFGATHEVFVDINKADCKSVSELDQQWTLVGIEYDFDKQIRTVMVYMNHAYL